MWCGGLRVCGGRRARACGCCCSPATRSWADKGGERGRLRERGSLKVTHSLCCPREGEREEEARSEAAGLSLRPVPPPPRSSRLSRLSPASSFAPRRPPTPASAPRPLAHPASPARSACAAGGLLAQGWLRLRLRHGRRECFRREALCSRPTWRVALPGFSRSSPPAALPCRALGDAMPEAPAAAQLSPPGPRPRRGRGRWGGARRLAVAG